LNEFAKVTTTLKISAIQLKDISMNVEKQLREKYKI
jgi:hypothetical protein